MHPELKLNRHALGLLVALVVQYLLGIAVSLYVQFPSSGSAGQLWKFSWKQPLLASHIVLAAILLLGSLALVILSYMRKSGVWKLPAWVGFLAITFAGMSGSQFIPTQSDPYSFVMAACFLLAFIVYCWGMYRAHLL